MNHRYCKYIFYLCLVALISSCSTTKYVPDNAYLLDQVSVVCNEEGVDVNALEPYIRQQTNSKWFSVFKIPLSTYNLSGRDTLKWLNRTLRNLGEEPMLYDHDQAEQTRQDLTQALHNLGYMHAKVELESKVKGKKMKLLYRLHLGEPCAKARQSLYHTRRRDCLAFAHGERRKPGVEGWHALHGGTS